MFHVEHFKNERYFMEEYLLVKDFLVSGKEFTLYRDPEKDLLRTLPVPDELEPFYKSAEYISHTDSKKGLVAFLYQWVKKRSIRRKIKLISEYSGDRKTFLDIGAGTGDLVLTARKRGFLAEGMEPNQMARTVAKGKGVEIRANLPLKNKYQVITLWHVLEHFKDPGQEIDQIKNLMEENGRLLIAVPNFRSLDAEYYKEHWAAYDVPRHLWHFSQKAVTKLFAEHQMQVESILPMPFDAYYVSILSEKYRHGRNRFLNAFWTGFRSNWKAGKNGEYSSLLYIIKKRKDN